MSIPKLTTTSGRITPGSVGGASLQDGFPESRRSPLSERFKTVNKNPYLSVGVSTGIASLLFGVFSVVKDQRFGKIISSIGCTVAVLLSALGFKVNSKCQESRKDNSNNNIFNVPIEELERVVPTQRDHLKSPIILN